MKRITVASYRNFRSELRVAVVADDHSFHLTQAQAEELLLDLTEALNGTPADEVGKGFQDV